MGLTIYKYQLKEDDYQEIMIKRHCKPLSCQFQNKQLMLWVELDTDQPDEKLEIYIIGTGHKLPDNKLVKFISTVQQDIFVWHIYTRDWGAEIKKYD